MAEYEAMLLGPGLTQEKETVAFVHALLGLVRAERRGHIGFVASTAAEGVDRPAMPPLIVDADGLNAVAGAPEWWNASAGQASPARRDGPADGGIHRDQADLKP
jgi:NAD(P)H-hydrate repair Nnr-like enzyme with NAD(P)H-hydrate dehydratase domain